MTDTSGEGPDGQTRLTWFKSVLVIAHPEHPPVTYDPATGKAAVLSPVPQK